MRGRRVSVEHLWATARFEEIRDSLLRDGRAAQLDKPLAHWALPTDRRLPLALLNRSLADLLAVEFDELAATPGVGRKKIESFLDLLARVVQSEPTPGGGNGQSDRSCPTAGGFDPENTSELVWNRWQESVRRCRLGSEPLGRVAPSLAGITRVIWNTPLAEYVDVELAALREKTTYGRKRVHSVLEVFHALHRMTAELGRNDHLTIRLIPRHVDEVERWVGRCLQSAVEPSEREILDHFIVPLIEQLRIDASEQVVSLAEIRVGIDGPVASVRQTARQMGLTRARVYQLLNEINDILAVRWPLGRCQVHQLLGRLESQPDGPARLDQFRAAVELFYPTTRRGADGLIAEAASE